ncbi:MAG TPA: DUF5685 family protein [Thermoanaerobaculia bacterium]
MTMSVDSTMLMSIISSYPRVRSNWQMFGFLNPLPQGREYRLALGRCRRYLTTHYGYRCASFVSFEAVFVYLAWCDASDNSPAELMTRRSEVDGAIGRLSASASLLLALVKMEDDVRDRGSILARAALSFLRTPFDNAWQHLESVDPRGRERFSGFLSSHVALEASGKSMAIETYVGPCAEAFGYAFALGAPAQWGSVFGAIGREIGSALIAFDCAIDWASDRAKGDFNPLADQTAVTEALAFSRASLTRALALCHNAFGDSSETASTITGVIRRFDQRAARIASSSHWQSLLAPVGSLLDSSPGVELRDKIWFCCVLAGGALLDSACKRPAKADT